VRVGSGTRRSEEAGERVVAADESDGGGRRGEE
jgi:hypothetical protein